MIDCILINSTFHMHADFIPIIVGVGKERRTFVRPWCDLLRQHPLLELP